jgi:hypothetical protein
MDTTDFLKEVFPGITKQRFKLPKKFHIFDTTKQSFKELPTISKREYILVTYIEKATDRKAMQLGGTRHTRRKRSNSKPTTRSKTLKQKHKPTTNSSKRRSRSKSRSNSTSNSTR